MVDASPTSMPFSDASALSAWLSENHATET
jgi:hypothetical protein